MNTMGSGMSAFEWHGPSVANMIDDANQIKFLKDSLAATNEEIRTLRLELDVALNSLQKMTAERNKLVNDLAVSSIDAKQSRHELRAAQRERDDWKAEKLRRESEMMREAAKQLEATQRERDEWKAGAVERDNAWKNCVEQLEATKRERDEYRRYWIAGDGGKYLSEAEHKLAQVTAERDLLLEVEANLEKLHNLALEQLEATKRERNAFQDQCITLKRKLEATKREVREATLEEVAKENKRLREIVEQLWNIIDDIDTYGDAAKSNDSLYRQWVEKRQKDRWNTGITTDGYTLNFASAMKNGEAV